MYLFRGLVAWAVMMAGESGLAMIRTLLLAPAVGDFRARQIGFFVGAALIFGVACLLIRWIGAKARGRLLAVGLMWAALTLLFEIGVGRLALGLTGEQLRERLREDYDPSGGGLMGVGLVVLALSPWAARRLRRPTRSGVGLTRSPTAGSVAGGRAATVAADPRAVSETDYPGAGSASEKLGFLLNYAVLAPSSHNTQPWLFRPAGDWVEVLADRTRSLPIADPDGRALVISCGAALGNLRVALRRFGHCGEERDFPDDRQPDLLARVGLGDRHPTTAGDVALFDALPRRRTNRRAFDPRPVPDELLRALVAAAADDGVWVQVVSGEDRRAAVAELVAEGDVAQASDQSFRRELAAWMRPNWSRRRDGMPGYAHGLGAVSSLLGPVVIRTFDWGRGRAAADRRLSLGSPALAVLGTDGDGPEDWLAAGRALATVLLRARAGGVDASFLNQPIEVPGLRARLRALLGTPGHPQLLVRMGYGPAVRATPRRPVSEVTLPGGGRGAGRSG